MRPLLALLLAILPLASAASDRDDPELQEDWSYLVVLNSGSYTDALEMLRTVGIGDPVARELLGYLRRQFEELEKRSAAYFGDLCDIGRDTGSREIFADAMDRQKEADWEFYRSVVEGAERILDVDALAPLREPVLKGGVSQDLQVADSIRRGDLPLDSAVTRTCEAAEQLRERGMPREGAT